MDRVGAARFIDSCCHDQCKPTDERVNKFFRCLQYGTDAEDDLISLHVLRGCGNTRLSGVCMPCRSETLM